MSREQEFSDEFLNAFVDGELAREERERLYREIDRDESLMHRVCELRELRNTVRMAYTTVPNPPRHFLHIRTGYNLAAGAVAGIAAGIVLVAFGVMLGWVLFDSDSHQTVPGVGAGVSAAPAVSTGTVPSAMATVAEPKVLIHLKDDSPRHMEETLDEVENLLKYYRRAQQSARVELVVNGDGLALLRRDVSPNPDRILRMQREYDNLTFVACQNTINRVQQEAGASIRLLPGVVVIDSGVAQIMRRQQQGWAYIQA